MRSLMFKLILAFLIVSLTGAAFSVFYIRQRTRSEFAHFLSSQFRSEIISALTQYYSLNKSWDGVDQLMQQLERYRGAPGFNPPSNDQPPPGIRSVPLILVDADRVVIYDGFQVPSGRTATNDEIAQGVPLEVDDQVVGWLTINSRTLARIGGAPEQAFLRTVNQILLISAFVSMVAALLLGIALARNLTRPIRELTAATQALARGELGKQVLVRSKDELGQLGAAFNKMSSDLAQATQARRQMTADIAHDLRSPLSVILGYTEALCDGKLSGTPEIFDVIYKEAGQLHRLIDDLRTLSLADAGELPLYKQPMQPSVLLERAVAAYRPLSEQKGILLEMEAAPNLKEVQVDPERMAQVLGNLLSNALRYTPAGGRICLSSLSTADAIELHVKDNGPGVDPKDQPYIFHRFYRSDPSRPHDGETGLGLAIAKSLVEAHGGSIRLISLPSQGAHFVIRFPL